MSGGLMKTPRSWVLAFAVPAVLGIAVLTRAQTTAPAVHPRAFFDKYCVTCHDQEQRTAGLALDTLDPSKPGSNADALERVIVKLRAGSMPPPGMPRPDAAAYRAVVTALENAL